MNKAPDLSIIVPAYNEARRLPPTLKRMVENLRKNFPGTFEIIVLDDGSKDGTSVVAMEFAEEHHEVSLITNKENHGRGFVMRQGVLGAKGRYILDTDADGSVDDEAIPRFYAYIESHDDVDMLIGSRTVEGAKILVVQPLLRVLLGYIFMILAWLLFRWRLVDRVNGFKFFKREVAHDVFAHLHENTFFGEAEVTYVTDRRGWYVKELPIFWSDNCDSRIRPWRESYRSFTGMFRILLRDWRGEYSKDLKNRPVNLYRSGF
jgi:dolichyl-phosphate beta-glucosyltransferase